MEIDVSALTELKKRPGKAGNYGPAWLEVPCLAVTKQGVTFNAAFTTVFGIERGNYLFVHVGLEQRVVVLKKALSGDCISYACKVSSNGSNKQHQPCSALSCKKLAAAFADCRGQAYRARLDPAHPALGRIIVIELTPQNMIH